MKLQELPNEMLHEVFEFLKNEDRYSIQNTSKDLRLILFVYYPRIYFKRYIKQGQEMYYLPHNDSIAVFNGRTLKYRNDSYTKMTSSDIDDIHLVSFQEFKNIPNFRVYRTGSLLMLLEGGGTYFNEYGKEIKYNGPKKVYIGKIKVMDEIGNTFSAHLYDGNNFVCARGKMLSSRLSSYYQFLILENYLIITEYADTHIYYCIPFSDFD